MQNRSSYIFAADVLRTLAIIGVVAIHTTNAVYARPDFLGGTAWWIAIILDSLSRAAIPLFIMLSGYLLLQKDESFVTSLRRTFLRILLPLMVWILIYMFWNDGHPTLNAVNLSFFLKLFSVNVFHLYFLVIMLGLYCIAPLLRSFLKTAALPTQKNFLLFALLAGMLQVIGQYLFQQCSADTVFTMWVPYTGLFVAGYLLGHNVQSIKKIGRITMLYLLGLGLTLGLNYIHFLFLSHGNDFLNGPGCISHYSDYYLSINVVLMSLCAFLLLLHFQYNKIKNTVVGKLIYSIARASFGIYLVHLLIVQFIEIDLHLTVDQTHMPLLVYVFISWLLVFLISYAISLVIAKIPVLKWAIGAK